MFSVRLCYAVLPVPCSIVVSCCERADLLAHSCIVFSCVLVTFHYGVMGQLWYLNVLISNMCLPLSLKIIWLTFATIHVCQLLKL